MKEGNTLRMANRKYEKYKGGKFAEDLITTRIWKDAVKRGELIASTLRNYLGFQNVKIYIDLPKCQLIECLHNLKHQAMEFERLKKGKDT